MEDNKSKIFIEREFLKWQSIVPKHIISLNLSSGSNRTYYRINTGTESFIATINDDIRENEAFFYLASFFKNKNISVPVVGHISQDKTLYIQQDLGDVNLLQILKDKGFNKEVLGYYKESLKLLWKMQYVGQDIDYQHSYPRSSFDQQSIMWDLNYFKYYFLKVSGISFDEQLLEDDMMEISNDLAVGGKSFFMFRDFQARNIQIYNGKPWFIDFQGGRRGPILYDVASLLYQASAGFSKQDKENLLAYYYTLVIQDIDYPGDDFQKDFRMMVLIRIVQTLGAYGFRGLIEGKAYFKASIPNALTNLKEILLELSTVNKYSYFFSLLHQLVEIKDNFVINNK